MAPLCYRRHRFPPEIIQHAIWLYLRFTLSYRDVEELLAERGLDISYETVRRWVLKFGPAIARRLRQRRPRPSDRRHLDEMVEERRFEPSVPLATVSLDDRGAEGAAGRSRAGGHRSLGPRPIRPQLAPLRASGNAASPTRPPSGTARPSCPSGSSTVATG